MKENLLEIRNLSVAFKYDGKFLPQTRDVSFNIRKGEIFGLVGESGSGKSVTSKALLQLLPPTSSKILSGTCMFEGEDILKRTRKQMTDIRGNKISMIFQEPMTSLNPVFTCGDQIIEAIILHQGMNKRDARKKAIEMMARVGISLPEVRVDNYPHEMSGGMRQRIMIAMALSCNPSLLIADEPTTALDPTIQAQILELLQQLQEDTAISVLYISHDLGVIAEICDRVAVMYAGTIMEIADVRDIFYDPWHPYTIGLLSSIPRMDTNRNEKLATIEGTVPHFSEMPEGCSFASRCRFATEKCHRGEIPPMQEIDGHAVRCFNFDLVRKAMKNGRTSSSKRFKKIFPGD